MERIEELAQLKTLTAENKARFEKVSRNSLTMLSEMGGRIAAKDVSFEWLDNGLLIFLNEGRYYNLHYYMKEGCLIPEMDCGMPVLVEEPEISTEKMAQKETVLLSSGFSLYRRNLHVLKDLNESDSGFAVSEEALEFRYADMSYADSLMQDYLTRSSVLWFDYLNDTDIPKDHLSVHEGDHMICALDQSDEIVAVHWWHNSGANSDGRHTVTRPVCYRKGSASALIAQWCTSASHENARRAFTWISDKNDKSLNLYSKMGFRQSGKAVRQYIRR